MRLDMLRGGQCCFRVAQRCLGAGNLLRLRNDVAVLLRRIQAGLRGCQALSRRRYFAGRSGAGRGQLGQRIQIVLRLIARQAILLDLCGGCLPFGLGAVVRAASRFACADFHARSQRSPLVRGPPRHRMSDHQFAAMHLVAFLRIHGFHRGGERAVELIRGNRLHAPVVAHGVLQHRGCSTCATRTGNRSRRKIPRQEKYGNQDDCRTDPKPAAVHLRSCFSHAINQSQYIRLESLKLGFRQKMAAELAGSAELAEPGL